MAKIHASCALPLVSKPVLIGKDYYYDGGVVDSIPVSYTHLDVYKRQGMDLFEKIKEITHED